MLKIGRYGLCFIAFVQFFFAVAFFYQIPFAVNLWPFEGTTPLTFIFIASIFAAAAASTLWAAVTENYGALAGIGLDYIGILLPVTVISFQAAAGGNAKMTTYGILCLFGALFGIGLLLWSRRFAVEPIPGLPGLVRGSFVFFIIALVIVSSLLITKTPDIIPWAITPTLSLIIGWMFVGAAMYFIYGLLRPSWINAAGQLLGFLFYDLVLVVPFVTRLSAVSDENRLGLYVYTAVVIFSGLLALYFLFINRTTRAATWHHTSPVTLR